MDNSYFKNILKEYEQKRLNAEKDLSIRKQALYSQKPRLKEIDDELNNYAINTAKSILASNQNSMKSFFDKKEKLDKEKKAILKSLGKDESELSPVYECELCKDTGYIDTPTGTAQCNCLKQQLFNMEYNKSNIGNLKKENFDNFNINLYSDEVNKEKYQSAISPRENILNIKKTAENFITNFDDPEEKNLLFRGYSGLGKTFLAGCIANELLKKNKTVLYQTAPVMFDEIIKYRFKDPSANPSILKNLLNVDLLIIDDLGTENMNGMQFTELFNIINTRLLNQSDKITKTIISTNYTLQQIHDVYEDRISSRIVGYYTVCKFFR